jgi:hypothetical protein
MQFFDENPNFVYYFKNENGNATLLAPKLTTMAEILTRKNPGIGLYVKSLYSSNETFRTDIIDFATVRLEKGYAVDKKNFKVKVHLLLDTWSKYRPSQVMELFDIFEAVVQIRYRDVNHTNVMDYDSGRDKIVKIVDNIYQEITSQLQHEGRLTKNPADIILSYIGSPNEFDLNQRMKDQFNPKAYPPYTNKKSEALKKPEYQRRYIVPMVSNRERIVLRKVYYQRIYEEVLQFCSQYYYEYYVRLFWAKKLDQGTENISQQIISDSNKLKISPIGHIDFLRNIKPQTFKNDVAKIFKDLIFSDFDNIKNFTTFELNNNGTLSMSGIEYFDDTFNLDK